MVGSSIQESLSRGWLPDAVVPGRAAAAGSEACDWSDIPAEAGAVDTAFYTSAVAPPLRSPILTVSTPFSTHMDASSSSSTISSFPLSPLSSLLRSFLAFFLSFLSSSVSSLLSRLCLRCLSSSSSSLLCRWERCFERRSGDFSPFLLLGDLDLVLSVVLSPIVVILLYYCSLQLKLLTSQLMTVLTFPQSLELSNCLNIPPFNSPNGFYLLPLIIPSIPSLDKDNHKER
jgi:hypothetical protein